jgi:uncharacterized membrane protein YphA (DoxX/SURF4 family)
MRKVQIILQMLLGLVFLTFGLNKFIGFIPMPQLGESATNFMMALGSTGYMFPVIGGLEILCGLSLLVNKYTAISLLLLAPITFNILGFHLALDQGGLIISVVMTLIHLYLIYDSKDKYKPLLK